MIADMELTRLALEDRRRLAYYLEDSLINAISPLAYCLDAGEEGPRLVEAGRHARRRILALVKEVREQAGLRPVAERRQVFPPPKDDASSQLLLLL